MDIRGAKKDEEKEQKCEEEMQRWWSKGRERRNAEVVKGAKRGDLKSPLHDC